MKMGKAYDVQTMSIDLSQFGRAPAMFARDVKVGDVLRWNSGSTSTVVAIKDETPAYVTIVEEYTNTFKKGSPVEQADRKMKKDRLVATVVKS